MAEAGRGSSADLTQAVLAARGGDLGPLARALPNGRLFMPLAEALPEAAPGAPGLAHLSAGSSLSGFCLVAPDGGRVSVLFTSPELMEPAVNQFGWQTSGGPLQYAALPALAAVRMVLELSRPQAAPVLLLNALTDSECPLSYEAVKALAEGFAAPGVAPQPPRKGDSGSQALVPGKPDALAEPGGVAATEPPHAFDKADWHLESLPDGAPEERAGLHIAFFLGWALERGLCDPAYFMDDQRLVSGFLARKLTSSEILDQACDGVLSADMLNTLGAAFTRDYYKDYLEDFDDLFREAGAPDVAPEDTWPNYEKARAMLDAMLADWKSRRHSAAC